jgi:hypothetical protein
MATGSVVRGLRWIARVWTVLSILFVGVFAVGEIMGGAGPGPTLQEWLGLALWPIGVVIGLAVAWHHEEGGGFLALGCLAAFYAWNLLGSGHLPRGPFFFLVAAPGVLFFIAGFLSHHHHHLMTHRT